MTHCLYLNGFNALKAMNFGERGEITIPYKELSIFHDSIY